VDAELVTYRHPTLRFSIDLPPDLELAEDIPNVALAAAERPELLPDGAFRGNVNVVVEEGPEGMDLEAYVAESLAAQERSMTAFRLIDREDTAVGAIPAVRTLAHYEAGETLALVVEQWRLIARGLGWVVTATSDPITYNARAAAFATSAESLRVEDS
jgi:hypothetical protein